MKNKKDTWIKKNDLAALLLISIFMNGFETGGYQAALLYIGQEYQLSGSAQGVMASVELFATMIAPIIFGSIADRIGKRIMLILSTLARVVSGFIILMACGSIVFAIGIFILGCATSIIQYVAIAEMDDAYPLTNHNRMGFITATYALGAVVAPLIVGVSVHSAIGWKSFFMADCLVSVILSYLLAHVSYEPREVAEEGQSTSISHGSDVKEGGSEKKDNVRSESQEIYYWGVFLLSFIMFIYVGVENGVGFFLNSYFYAAIDSTKGYLALSIFWFAMIPSRILCGIFAKYRKQLLCIAPLGATLFLCGLSFVQGETVAFLVVCILGFFCGAVYPNVLTYAADFAGKRTATVTATITVATGIGGTVLSAAVGFMEEVFGYRGSFLVLTVIMGIDIIAAIAVIYSAKRRGITK